MEEKFGRKENMSNRWKKKSDRRWADNYWLIICPYRIEKILIDILGEEGYH